MRIQDRPAALDPHTRPDPALGGAKFPLDGRALDASVLDPVVSVTTVGPQTCCQGVEQREGRCDYEEFHDFRLLCSSVRV
jgi:hypothetical protein